MDAVISPDGRCAPPPTIPCSFLTTSHSSFSLTPGPPAGWTSPSSPELNCASGMLCQCSSFTQTAEEFNQRILTWLSYVQNRNVFKLYLGITLTNIYLNYLYVSLIIYNNLHQQDNSITLNLHSLEHWCIHFQQKCPRGKNICREKVPVGPRTHWCVCTDVFASITGLGATQQKTTFTVTQEVNNCT